MQRLVANNFKFTESQRTRDNREAVKRDSNNVFDFLESEGYIRLKADCTISSKDLYEIYRMWCEENNLTPLKRRSLSDSVIPARPSIIWNTATRSLTLPDGGSGAFSVLRRLQNPI